MHAPRPRHLLLFFLFVYFAYISESWPTKKNSSRNVRYIHIICLFRLYLNESGEKLLTSGLLVNAALFPSVSVFNS